MNGSPRRIEEDLVQPITERLLTTHSDLKPLSTTIWERRATQHFSNEPVAPETIDAILRAGTLAPSGYNLQPWRFVVVQDSARREVLKRVSMNQNKIAEAPVVIIAVGMKQESRRLMREVFRQGVAHGIGSEREIPALEERAERFLDSMSMEVWVNRHTMIAVTTMMLMAEACGISTAPMEGFDPEGIKQEFGIPAEGEVVCLLALGHASPPFKPFPGRFAVAEVTYRERFGDPWVED